jgi:hypothetical protein
LLLESTSCMSHSLGLTLGALELGVMLSTLLYEMSTVRMLTYSQESRKDVRWLRALVGLVWSVVGDTLQPRILRTSAGAWRAYTS